MLYRYLVITTLVEVWATLVIPQKSATELRGAGQSKNGIIFIAGNVPGAEFKF
jgi:hypothetical protein